MKRAQYDRWGNQMNESDPNLQLVIGTLCLIGHWFLVI